MSTSPLPERVRHQRFAADRVKLEGSIAVAAFTRFVEALGNDAGQVDTSLAFSKAQKRRVLVLGKFSTTVSVLCQNCGAPMSLAIEGKTRLMVVPNEDDFESLSEEEDGLVCEADHVSLVDLLEDELLLSLPMVIRHDVADCSAPVAFDSAPEMLKKQKDSDAQETYRPFAGLAALKAEQKDDSERS